MKITDAFCDRLAALAIGEPEIVELQQGKVVLAVPPDGSDGFVRGLVHVPTDAAATWAELERWETLHEIVPQVRCRVVQTWPTPAPGERRELVAIEIALGLFKTRFSLWARFKHGELRQWWSLVPPAEHAALSLDTPSLPAQSAMLRDIEGRLSVLPCDEGCLILHESRLVHHPAVPRPVQNLLSKQLVREFLGGGRKRLGALL
jgi:hypothetical protein